ncbi:MAG: S8 family serine peptidase [Candidatus Hodarchaeales archaeon]
MFAAIKKILVIMVLCLSLFCGNSFAEDSFVPNQLIMRIIPSQAPEPIVVGITGTVIDSIQTNDLFLVEFPATLPVQNAIDIISNLPEVIFAQPNYQIWLPEIQQMSISFPDEKCPSYVAGTSPESLYEQAASYDIGLDSTHILSNGVGTVVAVIDNGIDSFHPLFDGYIDTSAFDFIDMDDDPMEELGSAYGHGTFVSGLIRLIAPEAMLFPIRAFDGEGMGTSFSISKAIDLAVNNNVDVINMSFIFQENNLSVEVVCNEALNSGIVLIAAAGNQASSLPTYPAALSGVIAVSAIDSLDVIADFSNYGSYIDLCAPGVNLYSSLAGEYEWGTWSGTSFSTPLVSATCALILSISPEMDPYDMENHVRASANRNLQWGQVIPSDIYYGYGQVDAFNSLVTISYGDINNSGSIDISDLTKLVSYLFQGYTLDSLSTNFANFNCDDEINISDLTAIVSYLFGGGINFNPCY